MSNYTNENLITTTVPNNVRAIKIGDKIFTGFYDMNDDAYVVVDDNGTLKAQKLSFNGTTPSDSGSPVTLENVKTFNTGHPEPQGGGGATEFYKCASVDASNSTWTGYKAVFDSVTGIYSFESTATSGLTYSVVTPVVGRAYADGALIKASLYEGIPVNGLVFYAPLSAASATAETGQGLLTIGNVTYQTVAGVPCCNSTADAGVAVDELIANLDPGVPKTVSCWIYITEWPSSSSIPFIIMTLQSGGGTAFQVYSDHSIRADRWSPSTAVSGNYATCISENMSLNSWYNIVAVDDGLKWKLYINGLQSDSKDVGEYRKTSDNLNVGITCAGTSAEDFGPYNLRGYMASARIYNRALSADEVFTLSKEFTPTT